MTKKPHTKHHPKRALIHGAMWTVGTRWLVRGLGFVNTVVMARLLMPSDYGIVAMGMLVVGLIGAFLELGATTALLRKPRVTVDEIDSAWTLRLIQGLIAGALLFAVTPIAEIYFEEPRLPHVLWTFATCVLLISASNIGQTLAQREFNYLLDFKISVASKLASVLVTIVAGFILGDYRALVLGIVAGYLTPLVLSYVLHPYRPRWNTSHIAEIWAITKWLMLASIGGFILRKGDELVAGNIGTTGEFGIYNVGADFGQLPVGEVGPAMLRALLPVLSSIQDEVARTNAAVIKTMAAVNTVIWPLGVGFAAVATEATALVLGSRWTDAVPFVAAFSIAAILQTAISPLKTLLVLRGHTRAQNGIVWLEFLAFACAALALVPSHHLLGLVFARIVGSLASALYAVLVSRRYCNISCRAVARSVGRPLLGASLMYFLVTAITHAIENDVLALTLGVSAGAVFFALWSAATWQLAGRPEGLESTLFDRVATLRKERRSR